MRQAAIFAGLLSLLGAASAFAAPAATESAQGKRAFLSVPVWYLDFDVDVTLDAAEANTQHHHSHTSSRILLDMRNQGQLMLMDVSGSQISPELQKRVHDHPLAISRADLESLTRAAGSLLAQADDAANWMEGPPAGPDSAGVSTAAATAAWIDSSKATQFLEYTHDREGYHDGARGSGRLYPTDETYHFEVDVAKGKFAALLPVHFTDLDAVAPAMVRGQSKTQRQRPDGTQYWDEQPIELPIDSGMPPFRVDSHGQKPGLIIGTLPEELSEISGSVSYPIVADPLLQGTIRITFTASPFPPKPVELVIKEPPGYRQWRPRGSVHEYEEGNTIQVEAELHAPGGGDPAFKAGRITWELLNTSHEPGVCMNWPPSPHVPPWPDFKIQREHNPRLLIDDTTEWQRASQTGDLTGSTVTVSCFDFGAHAALQVTAELTNGDILIGVVAGTPERSLKLPARQPGSLVADVYKQQYGAEGQIDGADLDDDPECDGFAGDGLTLYEEYRGFWVGGEWLETDPWTRDVFVQNTMRSHGSTWNGIRYYRGATHLKVHDQLEDEEVRSDHVINFLRSDTPHVVDQHVIYIMPKADPNAPAANAEQVGTPGTAHAVHMPAGWKTFHTTLSDPLGGRLGYFAATLAHEMLHSSNVYHHGEADETVTWKLMHRPDGTAYMRETSRAGEADVIIRNEKTGRELHADSLLTGGETEMKVWLGVPSGQHSGVWNCLMRYDCAEAYRSRFDPAVRYYGFDEDAGAELCSSIVGTGVNGLGHSPQSRYLNAAAPDPPHLVRAQRGRCDHQVRISDVGTEPRR